MTLKTMKQCTMKQYTMTSNIILEFKRVFVLKRINLCTSYVFIELPPTSKWYVPRS